MNYYSIKDSLTFISNMKNVELGDKIHFKGDVTLYVKNKDWDIPPVDFVFDRGITISLNFERNTPLNDYYATIIEQVGCNLVIKNYNINGNFIVFSKNVIFENCVIDGDNISFKTNNTNITFNTCSIINIQTMIESSKNMNITFNNMNFNNIDLSKHFNRNNLIEFYNCTINDILIDDIAVEFYNCVVTNFSISSINNQVKFQSCKNTVKFFPNVTYVSTKVSNPEYNFVNPIIDVINSSNTESVLFFKGGMYVGNNNSIQYVFHTKVPHLLKYNSLMDMSLLKNSMIIKPNMNIEEFKEVLLNVIESETIECEGEIIKPISPNNEIVGLHTFIDFNAHTIIQFSKNATNDEIMRIIQPEDDCFEISHNNYSIMKPIEQNKVTFTSITQNQNNLGLLKCDKCHSINGEYYYLLRDIQFGEYKFYYLITSHNNNILNVYKDFILVH